MKLKNKILILGLMVWLNLFQPLVVLSQEIPTETPIVEPTAIPSEVQEVPTETPPPAESSTPTVTPSENTTPTFAPTETPMVTPMVLPTESQITETPVPTPIPTGAVTVTTGDAAAGSSNDLEINNIGQTIPGDVGSCNLEIGCSEVNNQNIADIGTTTSVSSDSGNNNVGVTASMAIIDTGNAVGLIDNSNVINQNQIILIVETNAEGTSTDSSLVKNNNQATVDNAGFGNSNSGNNNLENGTGDGMINTGDIQVVANMVNQINTNQIGSNIKIYIVNNPTQNKQDLDLNQVWRDLLSTQPGSISLVDVTNQMLINQNRGNVSNLLMLSGNSGNNIMTVGQDGKIVSGNVTVLANLINLLNINLIGSKIFLGVINIRGNTLGDIILPNPEIFAGLANDWNSNKETTFQWINEANISQNIEAKANSGTNQIAGNGTATIQSGNAIALVNNETYANINSTGNNWFAFRINALGGWEGQIINWGNPGSVVTGVSDQFSLIPALTGESGESNGTLISINQNMAFINNRLILSADSGNNSLTADNADIASGNSTVVANIFNLANLNVWASNWFWGTINVIGDWKGNVIFAYPDLTVTLSCADPRIMKGEIVKYDLSYSNIGYDVAKRARIEIEIPEGTLFESDNSNLPREIVGNKIFWQLNDIEPKEGGGFSVWLSTKETPLEAVRRFFSIVKPVMAAENEEQLVVKAKISTAQSESNLDNNSSTAATIVWFESEPVTEEKNDGAGNDSIRLPKWEISAKNNVNNFVYLGDVVTFEVVAKNTGEDTAYDSYLFHQIYDLKGNLLRTDTINLGEVGVGKGGKVNFGIKMPLKFTQTTSLSSVTQVVGFGRNGEEIRSNKATTMFVVKVKGVATIKAVEKPQDEVLGINETVCEVDTNILPYILLFIVSGFGTTKQATKWIKKLKKK